jgi:hypothetical protein
VQLAIVDFAVTLNLTCILVYVYFLSAFLRCHAMQCIFMLIITMLVNLGLYMYSAQRHFFAESSPRLCPNN